MSTNVNAHDLKSFLLNKFGLKINKLEAKDLKIEDEKFAEVADENFVADIDDIMEDTDLYEKFATLYLDEREKIEVKDKEKEKEEQEQVKGSQGKGTA